VCNDPLSRVWNVHGFEESSYRGEQYLLGAGTLTLTRWTPNALSFEVDVPSLTVLVVNQNYDPNWRVISGRGEVFANAGLIAVRIPAGRQELTIAFHNRAFMIGLPVSLLTVIAGLVVGWAERRRASG
jgi:uncharacterized membrane protein YfhO